MMLLGLALVALLAGAPAEQPRRQGPALLDQALRLDDFRGPSRDEETAPLVRRVVATALLGGLLQVGTLGGTVLFCFLLRCEGAALIYAATAVLALTGPLAAVGVGAVLEGRGHPWVTLAAGVAGAGLMLWALKVGTPSAAWTATLPLLLSITAYELSHALTPRQRHAAWVPLLAPGGGGLALVGRF